MIRARQYFVSEHELHPVAHYRPVRLVSVKLHHSLHQREAPAQQRYMSLRTPQDLKRDPVARLKLSEKIRQAEGYLGFLAGLRHSLLHPLKAAWCTFGKFCGLSVHPPPRQSGIGC